jgi:hypothetical protein
LTAVLITVLLGATPAAADVRTGAELHPDPTVSGLLPTLDGLAGTAIAEAINNPDAGYEQAPLTTPLGVDGADGQAETSSRVAGGSLVGELVVSTLDGGRSVATVRASLCPNTEGKVNGTITINLSDNANNERVITASLHGTVNDRAQLTSSQVTAPGARGREVALLERYGKQLLEHAEAAWRNGYCVKIDVSEGESKVVAVNEKVPVSATAKPRFGGGSISGPMTAAMQAGKRKVEPASSSASPAKFRYFAPARTPETGTVQLRSVSRRGIGTRELEYRTLSDYKIDSTVSNNTWTATKCGGAAGEWTVKIVGPEYQGTGTFTFDHEPEEGQSVSALTPLIVFTTADGLAYREQFQVTFYAPGAPTPYLAAGDKPSFSVDGEGMAVQVGSFCR